MKADQRENWEREVLEIIHDLSSRERQLDLWWLSENYNRNEMQSPVEMATTLLDDLRFEDFLLSEKQLPIELQFCGTALLKALDELEPSDFQEPYELLLDSSRWQAVRHAATCFLENWRIRARDV